MNEIVESVKRVTDIMSEITAASQEQTSGIEQINQAITQMDDVTQQNASLVEEAAAAAQSLQDQAGKLAQVVSVFKLNEVTSASTSLKAARSTVRVVSTPAPARASIVNEKNSLKGEKPFRRIANGSVAAGDDWEEF
jgi:hypothetical protein